MKMEKFGNYLKQNKLQYFYVFYFKMIYLFIWLVVVLIYNNNYVMEFIWMHKLWEQMTWEEFSLTISQYIY